jgi:hypothetical protein
LTAVLDECFWVIDRASMLASDLELELRKQSGMSDPVFTQLHQHFPKVPSDELLLALQYSEFDLELAILYFENTELHARLKSDLPSQRFAQILSRPAPIRTAPQSSRSPTQLSSDSPNDNGDEDGPSHLRHSVPAQKDPLQIDVPERAKDYGPNISITKRVRHVLTHDLHGCTRENYRPRISAALEQAREMPGIDKVNFITGKESKFNKKPSLLRPLVITYLESIGITVELMEKNPGIVQAFIRKEVTPNAQTNEPPPHRPPPLKIDFKFKLPELA